MRRQNPPAGFTRSWRGMGAQRSFSGAGHRGRCSCCAGGSADDKIEPGQWLKGRIYERRCDLSPDGDLLIYFAAKWNTPLQTWTAVSRTPYLTALALWPKGDAWGGGGVFMAPKTIGLNHPTEDAPRLLDAKSAKWHPLGQEKQTLPKDYKFQRWSEYAGSGEDNPILYHRATRDGWVLVDEGDAGTPQPRQLCLAVQPARDLRARGAQPRSCAAALS